MSKVTVFVQRNRGRVLDSAIAILWGNALRLYSLEYSAEELENRLMARGELDPGESLYFATFHRHQHESVLEFPNSRGAAGWILDQVVAGFCCNAQALEDCSDPVLAIDGRRYGRLSDLIARIKPNSN